MNKIICGDALATLKTIESGIVQTCCTSPPYFGLRSYIADGHPDKPLEIGLEESPESYIARLVEVFREVKRVLRPDGTLWVNIGDSYAGSGGYYPDAPSNQPDIARERHAPGAQMNGSRIKGNRNIDGLKPKDLIGIPWMLAFALRADGWYLRSDIIWHKPNCMPESVEDRPTKAHEYIFLLSKSERYFYDSEAIRETGQEWNGQAGTFARSNGKATLLSIPGQEQVSHRENRDDRVPSGRNKRSVWTVSTSPFSQAHFATFPPKLIEPCILAGTSPRACEHCGAPWERVTEKIQFGKAHSDTAYTNDAYKPTRLSGSRQAYRAMGLEGPPPPITTGWQPTCSHANDGTAQSIVLDPFCGAGTVPLVSIQHHRAYIGIELNPEYVTLIQERIETVQPVLWEVPA